MKTIQEQLELIYDAPNTKNKIKAMLKKQNNKEYNAKST